MGQFDIRECAGCDLSVAIVKIEFDPHRLRVFINIMGDSGNRDLEGASWIRRYAEGHLLAFWNTGCMSFRLGNDVTDITQLADF